MRDFMQYLEHAFYTSSHWDIDNSYASVTATAQGTATWTLLPDSLTDPVLQLFSTSLYHKAYTSQSPPFPHPNPPHRIL